MSNAEQRALEVYPKDIEEWVDVNGVKSVVDNNSWQRAIFLKGYHQAEKDIKEELSELFREFMMDCINDSTDTHILHFVDVFSKKIKTIGNE